MQEELSISPQLLNYYLKLLLKANLISRLFQGKYELTQSAKNIMIQYDSVLKYHIDLHNIIWEMPILQEGTTRADKCWRAKSTIFKSLDIENCHIRWTNKTLTVAISNIISDSGHDAQDKARSKLESVISMLKRDGFNLGEATICRKPEFAFVSGFTKSIAKEFQLETDKYSINSSQSKQNGEIELFTAEDTDNLITNLIRTHEKVERLENHISSQTEIMSQFTKQIALHLEVMKEMKETMKDIRDNLKK